MSVSATDIDNEVAVGVGGTVFEPVDNETVVPTQACGSYGQYGEHRN